MTDINFQIAVCDNPSCPHPLHKMSVDDYKKYLIAQAEKEAKP